jgi:predicted deacylase
MIATPFSRITLSIRRFVRAMAITLLLWGAVWSTASAQSTPPVEDVALGTSTQGRAIDAVRVGDGPRKLVLVGATHSWPERNTYKLSLQLIDYFRANPDEVSPSVSLYIVPLLNPDGLALESRRNANNVDLNRNMDTSADRCPENDWQQRINGAYGRVSDNGGPYSESEVESRLIRDFLLDADGVILYHSNAGVVFPACDHPPSLALARTYAEAAGYTFIPKWNRYAITGGMQDWAGGMGIPAITPELVTGNLPEFEQNLAGVQAVLAKADQLLHEPDPRKENGIEVQPVIWRAWRAWGGEQLFGKPLAPAEMTADGWTQLFEGARFEYRPDRSDSPSVVQLSLLGQQLIAGEQDTAATPRGTAAAPDQPKATPDEVFDAFRERHAGPMIFGKPVAAPATVQGDGGRPMLRQIFQRAMLERPADSTGIDDVRLVPLGRFMWAKNDAVSGQTSIRAR